MKKFLGTFIILIFGSSSFLAENNFNKAVTYELSPGRFGDNLLSYIHAKWISYKYSLPLLYKPFIYSDQLLLHYHEDLYTEQHKKKFNQIVTLENENLINAHDNSSILYHVPYFPESKYELRSCKGFKGKAWPYLEVDWTDKKFIEYLKIGIVPCKPIALLTLPKNKISVAVHLRKGGNHDDSSTITAFPLKFVPDEFYIAQIKQLYTLLKGKPLYVYIFTDDNNPLKIVQKFKNFIQGCDIEFDCRKQGNCDTANVIEDFFALQQFDCLIHSESNFSFIMSKLGNYMISIFPDSFYKKDKQIIYDHINISINYEHEKMKT